MLFRSRLRQEGSPCEHPDQWVFRKKDWGLEREVNDQGYQLRTVRIYYPGKPKIPEHLIGEGQGALLAVAEQAAAESAIGTLEGRYGICKELKPIFRRLSK